MQTAQQGFRLVAPLIGAGLLAAFGARPVIIGDALTFAVAIVTLVAIKVNETKPNPCWPALAHRNHGRHPAPCA